MLERERALQREEHIIYGSRTVTAPITNVRRVASGVSALADACGRHERSLRCFLCPTQESAVRADACINIKSYDNVGSLNSFS